MSANPAPPSGPAAETLHFLGLSLLFGVLFAVNLWGRMLPFLGNAF